PQNLTRRSSVSVSNPCLSGQHPVRGLQLPRIAFAVSSISPRPDSTPQSAQRRRTPGRRLDGDACLDGLPQKMRRRVPSLGPRRTGITTAVKNSRDQEFLIARLHRTRADCDPCEGCSPSSSNRSKMASISRLEVVGLEFLGDAGPNLLEVQ